MSKIKLTKNEREVLEMALNDWIEAFDETDESKEELKRLKADPNPDYYKSQNKILVYNRKMTKSAKNIFKKLKQ